LPSARPSYIISMHLALGPVPGASHPPEHNPKQALEMNKNLLLSLLLASSTLTLVSCKPAPPKQANIAVVNGAPISVDEFAREAARASERYPEITAPAGSKEALGMLLDSMITRKLMIQEAAKRGLSEEREFLDTIKMFWEQTLIKKLIDTRSKELSRGLSISDEEAAAYHRRMSARLTLLVVTNQNEQEARRISSIMDKGARPEGARTIGPIMIEDLDPADPLCALFDAPREKTAVIKSKDGYLSVTVLKREAVQTPPFSEIEAKIRQTLLEKKKQRAFDEWLEGVKEAAAIKIDRGALERVLK